MSRECMRFLIAPQDADGVDKLGPDVDGTCNNFIELPALPNNNN
jgi:hypothetical protein